MIRIKDLGQKSKSTAKVLFKDDLLKLQERQNSLKELYINPDTFSDRKIQNNELKVKDKITSSGSLYGTTASKKSSFKIRESNNGRK